MERRLTLAVGPEHGGKTVDILLRRVLCLSGTQVKRVKHGGILLDGAPVFVSARAAVGQTLTVLLEWGAPPSGVIPTEGPVDVVYEDEDLILINKAPGVAVHPGPGHYSDTLGNFLAWKYKDESNFVFRPVNRLDRGTSGLMAVARHAHAQERLKVQLHTGAFRRTYLAVCEGAPHPPTGIIAAPIGRAEGSALLRQVRPDGAPARTQYETLRVWGGRALVRLVLDTGRTHQIRVHMAHLGHPLTGDFLYGTEDKALISRTALHSAELELCHPISGKELHVIAPLPKDISCLVDL